MNDLLRLLSLADANTRVVLFGTTALGAASGVLGVFMLLRKRALLGDALSHSTLAGLALGFLLLGYKSFPVLLLSAALSAAIAGVCVLLIVNYSRIKEDAAIALVLSSFFGLGACLSRFIQNSGWGTQAGLETFIYGKAAGLLYQDAVLIALLSVLSIGICLLLFKQFVLLCFNPEFARGLGWSVFKLDLALLSLLICVMVVGLPAVGVVLIVSLLLIPAAAARFWSERLGLITFLSAVFGALSALSGASLSALYSRLPTGAVIVLSASFIFLFSLVFAPTRGLLALWLRGRSKKQRNSEMRNFIP